MSCLGLLTAGSVTGQIIVTNIISVADAFVRSVDPTHNYGGAGALAVSGSIATNVLGQQEGLLDSFMRFDVSGMVSNFNSSFGVGQWVIARATLDLFEQGAPNNTIFNRGVGPFEVRWITSDAWLEGSGNPNAPTSDGIVWNDEATNLNPTVDKSLGTFINGGTDGVVRMSLAMPSSFVSDLSSGCLVSFYFTATTNSTVGFTFHSHNFVDSTQWPFLEIAAIPMPQITSLVAAGSDMKIGFVANSTLTNVVEYKNDLLSGSWNPLTNITGASGNVTVIDSGAAALPKRFYRIRLTAAGD
jgi:hypothetical protein